MSLSRIERPPPPNNPPKRSRQDEYGDVPHKRRYKRHKAVSSFCSLAKQQIREALSATMPQHAEFLKTHLICTVTHASDRMTLMSCTHVIPKSLDSQTRENLEWIWNMEPHTLHLDSGQNVLVSTVDHRYYFLSESEGFFWLPTDLFAMDKLYRSYVTTSPLEPYDPNDAYGSSTTFRYRIVPFGHMQSVWEFREYKGPYTSFNPADAHLHVFPFEFFPHRELQIPPHFIIFDTGKKLDRIFANCSPTVSELEQAFPFLTLPFVGLLQQCLAIYRAWMAVPPPEGSLSSKASTPELPTHMPTPPQPPSPPSSPPPYCRPSGGTHHSGNAGDAAGSTTGAMDVDPGPGPSASAYVRSDLSAIIVDDDDTGSIDEDWTEADEQHFRLWVTEWAEGVHHQAPLLDDQSAADSSLTPDVDSGEAS